MTDQRFCAESRTSHSRGKIDGCYEMTFGWWKEAEGPFYTSILNDSTSSAGEILRFDPCCMRPACARFARSANILSKSLEGGDVYKLKWKAGSGVLIDNWRVLHARAAAEANRESKRVLERVSSSEGG